MIVATAVLHNLAILQNDLFNYNLQEVNLDGNDNFPNDNVNQENNVGGNALRRALIEDHFR